MILAFIALWSVCAIYLTYLFLKRDMKLAAAAYGALYVSVLLWAFSVFVVDAMNFGLYEVVSSKEIIYGSDMFGAFEYLSEAIYGMPTAFSTSVIYVIVTLGLSVLAVLGLISYKAVNSLCKLLKRGKKRAPRVYYVKWQKPLTERLALVDILKMNCRANC